MGMVFGCDDTASVVLPTVQDALDPIVGHDFIKSGTFLRVDLEHATDDISRFSREDSQQTPWSFDDFLALPSCSRCTLG